MSESTPVPLPVVAREPLDQLIEDCVREVAELPDRDSPDGWPEAMLVTGDELRLILQERLAFLLRASLSSASAPDGAVKELKQP